MTPRRAQHPALDARLLRDLADGGLLGRLVALEVPLGQAPLEPAGPVAAGDHRGVGDALATSTTMPPAEVSSTVDAPRDGRRTGRIRSGWSPGALGMGYCRRRAGLPVTTWRRLVPSRVRVARLAGLAVVPNPDPRAVAAAQRRAAEVLLRYSRRPGRAGAPVLGGGARARAGRRPGARRPARADGGSTRPRLHHRRPAGRRSRRWCAAGPTRTGTSATSSAPSAPRKGAAHVVEITTYRTDEYDPDVAQAGRSRSATPSRATCRAATSRSTRWPCGCRT